MTRLDLTPEDRDGLLRTHGQRVAEAWMNNRFGDLDDPPPGPEYWLGWAIVTLLLAVFGGIAFWVGLA